MTLGQADTEMTSIRCVAFLQHERLLPCGSRRTLREQSGLLNGFLGGFQWPERDAIGPMKSRLAPDCQIVVGC